MNKLLKGTLALFLAAGMMPAQADQRSTLSGFTLSASGLYVLTSDSKGSNTDGDGDRYQSTTTFDGGFGGVIGLGYQMNRELLGEVELGYRTSGIDDETYRHEGYEPVRASGIEGSATSLSLMANGIYTFDAGRFQPYFGGGLGICKVGSGRGCSNR